MLNVVLSRDIFRALIPTGFLTNVLNLYVFYSHLRAFILKKVVEIDSEGNEKWYFANVATCTYQKDRLYHFDDVTKFLRSLDSVTTKHRSLNLAVEKIPYLKNEIQKGSGRIFHKHFRTYLNDLQWLHLRTCHMNERYLKNMVRSGACIGLGVSYDSVKNLSLGQ
jgi:hypothetical protein